MNKATAILLVLAALIHLLPLPGVLGAARLAALYGIPIVHPDLLILMRHRAVLFGLLGALLLAAAFRPALRPAALAAGLISTASFLWLALGQGDYGEALRRVVIADVIALAALLLALPLSRRSRRLSA